MNYRAYGKLGYEVSALGMGCMRFPRIYLADGTAEVDREKSYEMIKYAVEHGVNYFDTALNYHNGDSEAVLGEALEKYKLREKVKIATKQLYRFMKTQGDVRRNLESQLKKLRSDHVDVYLIHNINSSSWNDIKARKIFEEYVKFRDEGLIGAAGFSYHGNYELFREVLTSCDWDMCQIQQNFTDTDKEVTEKAMDLAYENGVPVVVMEPLKGGGLANAPDSVKRILDGYPVKRGLVEWAFRHVINHPAVATVLSGVTTLEQLKENIKIFSMPDAIPNCLSTEEKRILAAAKSIYDGMETVPCTGCEYCMPCPQGVKISSVFANYNDGVKFGDFGQPSRSYYFLRTGNSSAANCVDCGECSPKCPQNIDIPKELKPAHAALKNWIE